MTTITETNNKELFDTLCNECDFDVSDVPKHGKGYVNPTAELDGVNYYFDTTVVWDYSNGIEEWLGGSWVIDQPKPETTDLAVITASKTEMASVIETGHIAVIKQIIENGNVDPILGYFEDKLQDLLSANLDPTNKKHRTEMRSFAASIGKSKKPITDMANDTKAEIEAKAAHYLEAIDGVKSESKRFEKRMNEIRDIAKGPAVEFDKNEDARKLKHTDKIAQMKQSTVGISELPSESLKSTLAKFEVFQIEKLNAEICEEYLPEYEQLVTESITRLTDELIPHAEKRESDEAELQALRDKQAKADAKELADKNARAAALQAEQDLADEKERNRQRESRLKMDSLHGEALLINQEMDNETKRIADIEQARINAENELKAEQKRQQDKRNSDAANLDNQKRKNNEALDDMMGLGYTRDEAVKFLTMIAKNRIRNLTINY